MRKSPWMRKSPLLKPRGQEHYMISLFYMILKYQKGKVHIMWSSVQIMRIVKLWPSLRQNRSKNFSSFKFLFQYTVNLQIMWQSSASFTYISSKVIKDTNVSQLACFQRMAHLASEWSTLCNGHQGELSRILYNSSLHWGVIFQSIYCFCIQSIFPTYLH